MTIKQELLRRCCENLNKRLLVIYKSISDIEQSLNAEIKSSAGDKHETGRAMLQIQREKAGAQLKEAEVQKEVLNRINPKQTTLKVSLGTVAFTSISNYYIAIGAGQIMINNECYYAISPLSPIGQLLMGKSQGDSFVFRGAVGHIIKIL